jgi:hypothetical protein
MKSNMWVVGGKLARALGGMSLAALVCLAGTLAASTASASPNRSERYIILGTIDNVDSAGNAITVKLSDGTEKTLQLAKRMMVNGRNEKMDRAEAALMPNERAVIYYKVRGGEETAVDVESVNHAMRKAVTGSLVSADKAGNRLVLQLANGREETFRVNNDAVIETGDNVMTFAQFDPQTGAQITLHYDDSLGTPEVSRVKR